jgi:hypothetical protein
VHQVGYHYKNYQDARSAKHQSVPYHNCIYSRLPEDEPSGLRHVEDIKLKYWFRKCLFRWFMLHDEEGYHTIRSRKIDTILNCG